MSGDKVATHIDNLLEPLQKLICPQAKYLQHAHRLDMDATGVLLFATFVLFQNIYLSLSNFSNKMLLSELQGMFASRQIIKKYMCITNGVPTVPDGLCPVCHTIN
jgi:23S rRNA-/tRNA-specific pseudouridylate synthase